MDYKYSQDDKSNLEWFAKDFTRQSLKTIALLKGEIRGLRPFRIDLSYPITAIAGQNGSGKSTVLALAACAFHNHDDAVKFLGRRTSYYTFSDFLIQTHDEISPAGVRVGYTIAHNNWKKSEKLPDGVGNGWQVRKKEKGGKWNDYDLRVSRTVVYFGIDRVVPHAEKSVYKSYRSSFADGAAAGWEDKVTSAVSSVLGQPYDAYKLRTHGKYRLPIVSCLGSSYSGFNMGAGEKALFEIFSAIFAAPIGTLFVVDEIELGLHAKAQKNLVKVLKELARERKIQVICTTHSETILASLPPEGRFFIEKIKTKTLITGGISPAFATGKLAGENSRELDVYVEDEFARSLLTAALPLSLRQRISIVPVGSVPTILAQLAARYRELKHGEAVAVLDGDKVSEIGTSCKAFASSVKVSDQSAAQDWVSSRVTTLPKPGLPPERFVLELLLASSDLTSLCASLHIDQVSFTAELQALKSVDPHDIFFKLATSIYLPPETVEALICHFVAESYPDEFAHIVDMINSRLA